MKNSPDKGHFEDQWKQAFEGKEVSPSPNVWKGIDAHLANQQAGNYRRTAIFYRWVAAASVVILLGWTGYYLVNRTEDSTGGIAINEDATSGTEDQRTSITELEDPALENGNELAQSTVVETETGTEAGIDENKDTAPVLAENSETSNEAQDVEPAREDNETMLASQDDSASPENPGEVIQGDEAIAGSGTESSAAMLASNQEETLNKEQEAGDTAPLSGAVLASSDIFSESSEETSGLSKGKPLGFDIQSAELASLEPEEIPVWDFELPEDEKSEDQALFAGLNFSPGVFNPNFSNSNVAAESLSDASFDVPVSQSVTESTVNQGFSYGVGMNAGFPLGRKWILQGGLEYQVGRSETSTSLIVESASGSRSALTFTNSFQAEDLSNTVSISAPTDVTSDYRFLSVPLKAGYSILDKKKFGLMISGGISSDFFLSNTISSDQNGVSSFRQSAGSDSPFRTVYFSGLSSLTVSYKLSTNYLILLEPSFKAALSDFSKSSEVFNSRPNSFGIGVGLRYRFR